MFFRELKATRWTKKQINKNLNTKTPINSTNFIHETDKVALSALKKSLYLTPFAVR